MRRQMSGSGRVGGEVPSRRVRRRFRGRMAGLVALAAGAVMVVSACSNPPPVVVTQTVTPGVTNVTAPSLPETVDSSPSSAPSLPESTDAPSTPETTSAAPKVRISSDPAFGTKNVGPNTPIRVTAFNATLDHVEMVGDDGTSISGDIAEDNHTWTSSERLKYGVTYQVNGTSVAADGTEQPFEGKLSTVKPKKTMAAYIQINDGATVGIAAPIVVTFAGSVTDRAAAEKNLHVTTTDENGDPTDIEGSWGWMPDEDIQGNGVMQSRVHFRPKDYWPAHTRVHVEADLYGVDYGSAWGREDITRDFKIGDNIVVKTDMENHRLYVIKDDKIFRNYAVSYGAESIPGHATVSGIHIVQEHKGDPKTGAFKMCNLAHGYCNVTEYWGVRINNNGEFIHANPETEKKGLLGKANVSNGCVNMSMKDAKEFFDMAYYGIPVEVTGTDVKMSEKDYVWDWSYSYAQWKTLSAL